MNKLYQNPPQGMTEDELLELCSEKNSRNYFRGAPFWTAEAYGFGKYIREYARYPKFLPLAIYTDHGPQRIPEKPYEHELQSGAPVMFYHSPESVKIWRKFSQKPCYTLFSPFVFYRRKNNITQDGDAKGTVVFVNHATADIEDKMDMRKYINGLKNLSEKFQPISVCLHCQDVQLGRHKIFMDNDIPVYTAGNDFEHFTERFYGILKKFAYASSNQVGSSLLYAVEMGVPFFIFGDRSDNTNFGDKNIPLGKYDIYEAINYYKDVDAKFRGLDCGITEEKKKLVEYDLGIYDGLSRGKMALVLYWALARWVFSAGFWKWTAVSLKKLFTVGGLKDKI